MKKLPHKECFSSSVKDRTAGDNDEKLDGHISNEDHLACKRIWNEFNMTNVGDIVTGWWFWKVYWHVLEILQIISMTLF